VNATANISLKKSWHFFIRYELCYIKWRCNNQAALHNWTT